MFQSQANDEAAEQADEAAANARRHASDALGLCLTMAEGAVAAAHVRPSSRVGIAATLVGRSVPEALHLVGLLFSICGKAQTIAALRAIEATGARPRIPPPAPATARTALVLAEAVEQNAVTLLLDAPSAAGQAPDVGALRAVLAAMTEASGRAALPGWDAVGGGGQHTAPQAWPPEGLAATVTACREGLRGVIPNLEHGPTDETDLRARLRETDSGLARTLLHALEEPPLLVSPPRALAGWSLDELAAPLRGTRAEAHAYACRPTFRGAPAETGGLVRRLDHPLVRALWTRGRIVAARLVAHALDLVRTLDRLESLARGGGVPATPSPTQALSEGPNAGVGAVETARGLLLHRVVLAQGRVADWHIVAPTEWTFHPDGALPRTLTALPATDRPDLARRVRLLVAAMDPCVACDMRFKEAAHA
jgi:hypothetical protein